MKTRLFSFLLLSFFSFEIANAQKATYAAFEIGPKYLIYENEEASSSVKTPSFVFQGAQSLQLGQELSRNFAAEIGIGYHTYGVSYRTPGIFGFNRYAAFSVLEIPLRLKGKVNLLNDWISVAGTIGYTQVLHNETGNQRTSSQSSTGGIFISGGSVISSLDSFSQSDVAFYVSDGSFGLLETGVSVGLNYTENIQIYIAGNYKTGFNRIIETDITYQINSEPERNARIFTNGSYYSLRAGVSVNISRFWRKEKSGE